MAEEAEEETSGTQTGPLAKELAALGAIMASLVAKVRIALPTAVPATEDDEHRQRARVTANLLREYQRCFGAAYGA